MRNRGDVGWKKASMGQDRLTTGAYRRSARAVRRQHRRWKVTQQPGDDLIEFGRRVANIAADHDAIPPEALDRQVGQRRLAAATLGIDHDVS